MCKWSTFRRLWVIANSYRMVSGESISTAMVSCFARAYHYKNNSIHIFADDISEKLLGDIYKQIANSMSDGIEFFRPGFEGTREDGLRLILDRQLSPSVLGRSAFCEDKLSHVIVDGCKQYLLLMVHVIWQM